MGGCAGVGVGWEHLTKVHPAQSGTRLGHKMALWVGRVLWMGLLGGWRGGVHLTKGQPAQNITKLGNEMSLLGAGGVRGQGC